MKYLGILLLLLLFSSCNDDLEKLEGHWRINGYIGMLEEVVFEEDSFFNDSTKCYLEDFDIILDFTLNTLDVANGNAIWNKNALVGNSNQHVEINPYDNTIIVDYYSKSLEFSYKLENDTLYLSSEEISDASAIKCKDSIDENFLNTGLVIELLKTDTLTVPQLLNKKELSNFLKAFGGRRRTSIFGHGGYSSRLWFGGCFDGIERFAETYSQEIPKAKGLKSGILFYFDKSFSYGDYKKILLQLEQIKVKKVLFAIETGNNEIGYLPQEEYRRFIELEAKKKQAYRDSIHKAYMEH